MIKECTVYGLKASHENHIRYIGQTTQLLRRRLANHMSDALSKKKDDYVYRWIRKSIKSGHKIAIHTIAANCALDSTEMFFIDLYKKLYADMTNTVPGGTHGNLGRKLSKETKKKMSKPKSEQARKNMRGLRSQKVHDALQKANWGNTYSQGEKNKHAVLSESDVLAIRDKLKTGTSGSSIAKEYGVKKSAISKINVGRTWKHLK